MTEYEKLKKKIKILTIIRWTCIIWFIIAISQMTLWGKTVDLIIGLITTIAVLYILTTLPIIRRLKNKKHDIDIVKIGNETSKELNQNKYTIKSSYTTECENKFYKILKDNFSNEYEIHPQIPLSSIIEKHKTFEKQYQNELYRVIDFGIFAKDSLKPLLLIEINDKSHKTKERKERDNKVKEICESANIELITFWTDYSNTEEYIINRIKKHLYYKV